MYDPIVQFDGVADSSLILEISIHVQDYQEKDLEHGNHSRILETSDPADVVGILKAEFKTQRGKIMVSRKSRPPILSRSCRCANPCVNSKVCADSAIADEARMYVKRRPIKWVRLVELDFQPSLRETSWLSSADMEFQCRG